MMKPFTSFPRILSQITGWDKGNSSRVLVLRGEYDILMTLPVMQRLANAFRTTLRQLVEEKKIDAKKEYVPVAGPSGEDVDADGVRSCVVPDAGHHMQNDVGWEVGANKLLDFYRQL